MSTLYFAGFCFLIAAAIVWGYKNDDFAAFNGGGGKKKFSLKKPDEDTAPEPITNSDEKDTPRANLL